MNVPALLAQAPDVRMLAYYACVLLVLGAVYYIFVSVVSLPAKVMLIVNVILGVVAAIVGIKVLVSFL